jgi:DNA-binding PucR family transcriptional regulator
MGVDAREDADAAASREQLVLDLTSRETVVRRRALADLVSSGEAERRFLTVTAVEFAIVGASTTSAIHGETALRHALSTQYRQGPDDHLYAISANLGLLLLSGRVASTEHAACHYAEQIVQRVRDLSAGRFHCVAGVGSVVAGLDLASETAQHARLARRAASSAITTPIATWGRLGAYGPLLRIPEDELDEAALPEELRRVLRVDHDHHFTETLRAYLDHACAGPAAAAALHIHRTTLYYRLRQVSDLTGLDLADGRIRLVLHLGLLMLDVIDARPRRA